MSDLAGAMRGAATVTCVIALAACGGHGEDVAPPRLEDPHPLTTLFPTGATFGEGWSYPETDGERAFRWMAERAEVRLSPGRRWSTMRLSVELVVPRHLLARAPTVRLTLDGVELDRFQADGLEETRTLLVPARTLRRGLGPELVIETSETAQTPGRTLGLALTRASWGAVGGEP